MWSQFLLQNIHFAINILGALVMFAIFWLYLDAWLGHKTWKEGLRFIGFLLLSLSFLVHASLLEGSLLQTQIISQHLHDLLMAVLRIPGYLLIIGSLILDPMQPHPEHKEVHPAILLFGLPFPVLTLSALGFAYPVLAALCGLLFIRRATIGLEDHLKPVGIGFFVLALSELIRSFSYFSKSESIIIHQILAPFGIIWILQQIILIGALLILRGWVFGYLLKRIQSQLFMIFTTAIVAIFLITTVTFTGLLLKTLQDETIRQLETDVKVLRFTIDSKKEENLSNAQLLTQNPLVAPSIISGTQADRKILYDAAHTVVIGKNRSSAVIVNSDGQTVARGEDREKIGDSLAEDPLVKRALVGETVTSLTTREGVLAPEISIQSVAPIMLEGDIVGAVLTASVIDTAFVDGIKEATTLETVLFGGNLVSATTFLTPDKSSRIIGIKEENPKVKETVLGEGTSFTGPIDVLNVPYFGSFLPLLDIDSVPIGMMFVGKPQHTVLFAASYAVGLTFLVTIALIVISIIPVYLIARYISYQLR